MAELCEGIQSIETSEVSGRYVMASQGRYYSAYVVWIVCLFLTLWPGEAEALTLSGMFGDHMVLQRADSTPIWGTAESGASVTIELAGLSARVVADKSGCWRVDFEGLDYGGPYSMIVRSGEASITLRDIMVGEVWLCSGQSNMVWTVTQSDNMQQELAKSNRPMIRLYQVALRNSIREEINLQGQWQLCSPDAVADFSAIAYYFGRKLHQELGVPVGLIQCAVGGTAAECWVRRSTLSENPGLAPLLERYAQAYDQSAMDEYRGALKRFQRLVAEGIVQPMTERPSNSRFEVSRAARAYDDSRWASLQLPGAWEAQLGHDVDGAIWLRREVTIPQAWVGQELKIDYGTIWHYDTAYFNGEMIGRTDVWYDKREYSVPASLVKDRRCTLALRVIDAGGAGGIDPSALMRIRLGGDSSQSDISLSGPWRYEYEVNPPLLRMPGPPHGMGHNGYPGGFYNGMVHPLAPYGIRGVIWYQGESNTDHPENYRELLISLVNDWRKLWNSPHLPFGVVQLPNIGRSQVNPVEDSGWADVREAQRLAVRDTPDMGLIVTLDLGDQDDTHPRNKQAYANRLADWALVDVYGGVGIGRPPTVSHIEVIGSQAWVHFDNVGSKLVTVDGAEATGFAIAGEDDGFISAPASIERQSIVLDLTILGRLNEVRYGWAENPVCNLISETSRMPVVPFRMKYAPADSDAPIIQKKGSNR